MIRSYTPSDKEVIITLMREFGDYLEQLDSTGRTDFAANGATYFTNQLLKNVQEKQGEIFVAEDNGEIAGFIGGYIEKQSEAESMAVKKALPGVVSEFFVTHRIRRSGLGSQLLTEMENYFREKGCTEVKLQVFAPNIAARSFYSKHNYLDRSLTVSKAL